MKNKFLLLIITALFSGCECNEVDYGLKHGDGVKDIDGNEYETVIIGEQEWMIEDLRVNRYNNGKPIQIYQEDCEIGYSNTISKSKKYNYHTISNDSLAPDGWHVANRDDIIELDNFLKQNNIISKEKAKRYIYIIFLKDLNNNLNNNISWITGAWWVYDSKGYDENKKGYMCINKSNNRPLIKQIDINTHLPVRFVKNKENTTN